MKIKFLLPKLVAFSIKDRCCKTSFVVVMPLFSTQAKKALQEQLELSRKLTQKQQERADSDDDHDDEEKEDTDAVDTSKSFGSLKADGDNPWGLGSNVHHETGSVQDNGKSRMCYQ